MTPGWQGSRDNRWHVRSGSGQIKIYRREYPSGIRKRLPARYTDLAAGDSVLSSIPCIPDAGLRGLLSRLYRVIR